LFQPLGRMLEEGYDLLDAFFHAVEFVEFGITLDDLVGKDPAQARVAGGVDQFWFANRDQHPFRCSGIGRRIFFTNFEVFLDSKLFLLGRLVTALIGTKNAHELEHLSLTLRRYSVVTSIQLYRTELYLVYSTNCAAMSACIRSS